jgi:hypothetical protein
MKLKLMSDIYNTLCYTYNPPRRSQTSSTDIRKAKTLLSILGVKFVEADYHLTLHIQALSLLFFLQLPDEDIG